MKIVDTTKMNNTGIVESLLKCYLEYNLLLQIFFGRLKFKKKCVNIDDLTNRIVKSKADE